VLRQHEWDAKYIPAFVRRYPFVFSKSREGDKLKALPDDTLAELARTGELELMYMHLQSLRNLEKVLVRVSEEESPANEWPELDSTPESPRH